ncbi:hypothetical protein GF312_20630 [Candidatus Poribacteria bacterium]|nr:hypothetical protein [Candidatus Poribacteria bacterium]
MRLTIFVSLVVMLIFSGLIFALDPFTDDFERADGDDVGNGWEEGEDEGISISIQDGEVIIQGTQDTDWERNGIGRDVDDISSFYFDYMSNDSFNMHMRIDDTSSGGYIDVYAPPGGSFSFANSPDGGWPGWTAIEGSQSLADQHNTLGIEKVGTNSYQVNLNGADIGPVLENPGITVIDRILLAPDSAAGTAGSIHIDNVIIDGGAVSSPVEPESKLSVKWGEIKKGI